jgi:hypothetical protein
MGLEYICIENLDDILFAVAVPNTCARNTFTHEPVVPE